MEKKPRENTKSPVNADRREARWAVFGNTNKNPNRPEGREGHDPPHGTPPPDSTRRGTQQKEHNYYEEKNHRKRKPEEKKGGEEGGERD